jgi:hypothetical protein
MRRFVSATVALLFVVGIGLAADKKEQVQQRQRPARGKVVSLSLKDGVGTLTVMARMARNEEPKEVKIEITKDTKFTKAPAARGQQGETIAADKVAETFKKDTTVVVQYEKKDDKMVAKTVSIGGGRRPRRDS